LNEWHPQRLDHAKRNNLHPFAKLGAHRSPEGNLGALFVEDVQVGRSFEPVPMGTDVQMQDEEETLLKQPGGAGKRCPSILVVALACTS